MAGTRAGGIHRVGTYAQGGLRRGAPVEWEAGDVKRSRVGEAARRGGVDDGARGRAGLAGKGRWHSGQAL